MSVLKKEQNNMAGNDVPGVGKSNIILNDIPEEGKSNVILNDIPGAAKSNIILIGMPGAGKSTVGVVLAKNMGLCFLDSDICIQEQEEALLHEIIAREGLDGFLAIENRVNAALKVRNHVIATGGSTIYGAEAMEHFSQIGTIVYLQLPYEDIKERLGDLGKRGVALKEGQTLYELYEERLPLYEQYAEVTVNCHDKPIRDIVTEIADRMNIFL